MVPSEESVLPPGVPPTEGLTAGESTAPVSASPAEARDRAIGGDADLTTDTSQLRTLATGQLLTIGRPQAVPDQPTLPVRRTFGWIAVALGVLGITASLFVGWALAMPLLAILFGVLSKQREANGRTLANIGIATGIAGTINCAIWIGYYALVFDALPR